MRRIIWITLAASAAAALAALVPLAPPTAQAADGVTVSRFPVSFSFFNPCINEDVDVSGTALAVIDTTPDNHGLSAIR